MLVVRRARPDWSKTSSPARRSPRLSPPGSPPRPTRTEWT